MTYKSTFLTPILLISFSNKIHLTIIYVLYPNRTQPQNKSHQIRINAGFDGSIYLLELGKFTY